MNQTINQKNNVEHHVQKVETMFQNVIDHLHEDIEKINEPQAKAMFETSAEVLSGLIKAFEH
jgi:peptidoglycan hydrolase CwlO-like protein